MDLPDHLKIMLSTGEGCDFSIIFFDAEGNKVEKRVHKIFLRRSPYFSAMLDLQGTEARCGSVTINNITKEAFDLVLHYLYTDKLPDHTTMEQAIDIACAGDYLQLEMMKSLAIERWKTLYMVLKNEDEVKNEAISALRSFAASPLNFEFPSTCDWRRVAEVFIIAVCEPEIPFNIETESSTFVEFLVRLCGDDFPIFTADDIVCDWVIAKNSDLTETQRDERKQLAAQLAGKISLHKVSLRALVVLSTRDVFPVEHLSKIMQKIITQSESPAMDGVTYALDFQRSHVVELEYENVFLLFMFEIDTDGNVAWEFLREWEIVVTEVTIKSYNEKNNEHNWPRDTNNGTACIRGYNPQVGNIEVRVAMEPADGFSERVRCFYAVDVCIRCFNG